MELYNREYVEGLMECEKWRTVILGRTGAQEHDTDTTFSSVIYREIFNLQNVFLYICIRYYLV
jgi:hypothetical protein